MSNTSEASGLHQQAANDHDAAATYHRKAADAHERNQMKDAKGSARAAIELSGSAHVKSKAAHELSCK